MARGRMINKKISNSKRVNDLPETAQLLYTWLIPHLDVNGCFYGSARMIKSLVFPRKKITEKRIEAYLKMMESSIGDDKIPLIGRYFADGEQFLFMPGFEGEQIGLRRDKEKPEFPTFDGKMTEGSHQKVGVRGREGEVEEKLIEDKKKRREESSSNSFNEINFSEQIAEIATLYEAEIGKITPFVAQELNDTVKEYPLEQVKDAIKGAVNQGKRKWSYVRGILRNWASEDNNQKLIFGHTSIERAIRIARGELEALPANVRLFQEELDRRGVKWRDPTKNNSP